jgi:PPM family protein phosphatase
VIPVTRAHLYVNALTHPGMRGKNNEDRHAVSAFRVSKNDPTPALMAIVADGVGGHRAGEVAAEMAVERISQIVSQSDASQPPETLADAIIQASQEIYQRSADPTHQGMSTTCACAWIIGDLLYIASVGDSRIYLQRGNSIHQLTVDHTWVQEAIDNGTLTPEQARNHPNAHVIRRHLGSQQPVIPDLRLRLRPDEDDAHAEANQGFRLQPGDRVLLCSDGLTDLVDENEILVVLRTHKREAAVQALVDLANSRGGHDNITIVTLEAPTGNLRTPLPSQRSRSLPIAGILLSMITLGVVGLITMFGLIWMQSRVAPTPTAQPTFMLGITSDPFLHPTLPPTHTSPPMFTATPGPPETAAASPTAPQTHFTSDDQTPISATYTPWPTSTLEPPVIPPTIFVP